MLLKNALVPLAALPSTGLPPLTFYGGEFDMPPHTDTFIEMV